MGYELGFYIPKDDISQSDRRENLKSYGPGERFEVLIAVTMGCGAVYVL
jgi:hypothetical protein